MDLMSMMLARRLAGQGGGGGTTNHRVVIDFTIDESSDVATGNKTYAEIFSAIASGKVVVLHLLIDGEIDNYMNVIECSVSGGTYTVSYSFNGAISQSNGNPSDYVSIPIQ